MLHAEIGNDALYGSVACMCMFSDPVTMCSAWVCVGMCHHMPNGHVYPMHVYIIPCIYNKYCLQDQ